MNLNVTQTKLVGLTMELELKAKEYKMLCKQLEKIKNKNINPNDENLLVVKEMFQKNYEEVVEINRKIKELKRLEEEREKQKNEKFNTDKLFNRKDESKKYNTSKEIATIEKQNMFNKIIQKIKKILKI